MDNDGPDYGQQQQAEQERWETTIGALSRVAKAGAKREDLETLCRECGVDIKDITV